MTWIDGAERKTFWGPPLNPLKSFGNHLSTQVDLPHIQTFRGIQARWQAYDAFARVCMAMGTNQSLDQTLSEGCHQVATQSLKLHKNIQHTIIVSDVHLARRTSDAAPVVQFSWQTEVASYFELLVKCVADGLRHWCFFSKICCMGITTAELDARGVSLVDQYQHVDSDYAHVTCIVDKYCSCKADSPYMLIYKTLICF